MDASAFPGAFGTMVADSNALVDAHIQVKLRAIAIMGRYAIGDLSQDMERLPGEKAVITDAETRKKALDQITLDYTIKESSGTTMVPASDKRPAVDLVANALHGLNPDGMD